MSSLSVHNAPATMLLIRETRYFITKTRLCTQVHLIEYTIIWYNYEFWSIQLPRAENNRK